MSTERKKYRFILERQNADAVQTLGTLYIVNESDRIQFKCWSLELPPLKNLKMKSSVPAGEYKVVRRWSQKYGNHFHVLDIEDRSLILIHPGNTYLDTKGCILVGNDLGYVNNDSHLDLLNSKDTMAKLLELIDYSTTILIVENEAEEEEEFIQLEEK